MEEKKYSGDLNDENYNDTDVNDKSLLSNNESVIPINFSIEDIKEQYEADNYSNTYQVDNNNNDEQIKYKEEWYCFMMVIDRSLNNNDLKEQQPNRTILGVSKDPYNDLELYNSYGPSRNSPNNKTIFFNNNSINPLLSNDNLKYKTSVIIKKKKRKKKNKGPNYNIGMIITGFSNFTEAQIFCDLWNNKSRGPIPRSGWGIILASHFELKVFADFGIILNEPLIYYDIIYRKNKILIKKKS
jgi:hypothetical protein